MWKGGFAVDIAVDRAKNKNKRALWYQVNLRDSLRGNVPWPNNTVARSEPPYLFSFLFFFFDSSLNKRSSILFNFNCLLSDFWCSIWTKDTMRQANIFLLSSHILRAGMSECTPLVSFPLCNIPTVSSFVLLLANPGKKKKKKTQKKGCSRGQK